MGFHTRAFSKISSQVTLNSYGTTEEDTTQIKKVIKGGNERLLFPAARSSDRFGMRNAAHRGLESKFCQG